MAHRTALFEGLTPPYHAHRSGHCCDRTNVILLSRITFRLSETLFTRYL